MQFGEKRVGATRLTIEKKWANLCLKFPSIYGLPGDLKDVGRENA